MADAQPAEVKKAGALIVAKAVFWSFLGIRKRTEHAADTVRITPAQVIVAGIIGAALFITTILLLVRFVISNVTT
ncbi:MAG: DUF2970 domain-containing protein [Betaproteobacteria bacterium]